VLRRTRAMGIQRDALALLEDYVTARLRERGQARNRMTLVARLPRWLKSAKNRDEVLRAITRLREAVVRAVPGRFGARRHGHTSDRQPSGSTGLGGRCVTRPTVAGRSWPVARSPRQALALPLPRRSRHPRHGLGKHRITMPPDSLGQASRRALRTNSDETGQCSSSLGGGMTSC
jgi:hypothetical protein